jgi:hypothetical protein
MRAGFKRITYSSVLAEMDLRSQIVMKVQWKTKGEFTFGLMGIAARVGYYAVVQKVSQTKLFNALYRQLSLGDGLWIAKRDSA